MANTSLQKKTRREKRKDAGVVILQPRITEKGTILAEQNAYVFNVAPSANKREVLRAIEDLFKVRPRDIRMVSVPGKRSSVRGTNRWGRSAAEKKAYVYLKKGDVIDVS